MIVLIHGYHKCSNTTPVQHFRCGFNHANFASSFRGSNIYQMLDLVMRIFFSNMNTQNALF